MPPTIHEQRAEVRTNNFGKMQYIPFFDCIDIVLDQSDIKEKQINARLTYDS